MTAFADYWPAVVNTAADEVEFVAVSRAHLLSPEPAGCVEGYAEPSAQGLSGGMVSSGLRRIILPRLDFMSCTGSSFDDHQTI